MIALHEQRQRLEEAFDPFKYLDRGAPFRKLPEAFAEEIKYGRLLADIDLGAVRHDVDGIRLEPDGDGWRLEAQLKHRDPADGWASWQYEEDGRTILRRWVPVYRWRMDDAKARYYRHALPVLGEFAQASAFPGGKTRTTQKKLAAATVPAFEPGADLAPLEELGAELAGVRRDIEATDRLIDLVVYRLYGLTEEEVAIVEGERR